MIMIFAQSAGAAFLQRSSMDMTLNNLVELWRMRTTPLLPSLPSPLWPGVEVSDRVPIYGSNRTKLRSYAKLIFFK